uniref:Coenzyme PQQ synthesis protein F-like C-terminal lobe domain-containing protein n=1 Tax=Haptolina ericina TaxID=156174 RepID=A0A7S3BZL8_9EUKA
MAAEGCVEIPLGGAVRTVAPRNAADSNCAVEVYWQVGKTSNRRSALLSLLDHIMDEPLFDTLRTKRQLGYSVRGSSRNTLQMLGYVITVVSATHSPTEIEEAVLAFLETFTAGLTSMPAAEYKRNVEAAVANKLQDDHNMLEEADRYFSEVATFQYCFQRAEEEAEEMSAITRTEFASFVHDVFMGADARSLHVHVHKGADEALPQGAVRVSDVNSFKSGLPTHHPQHKPLPPLATTIPAARGSSRRRV